jgi:hypothetical protein
MAPSIDVAFVEEYNSDVHLSFQQLGSRLMGTTRKGAVRGSVVYFQIFGSLAAQSKSRNAQHTFIDPLHTRVSATMVDWYIPTLIDDLDLLKINTDEKMAHVRTHVGGLGKKADEIIIAALDAGANATDLGDPLEAMDLAKMLSIVETFSTNEVPDDGQRFCAVHPKTFIQMLKVSEFANADFVGQDSLPFKGGMTAKLWMGVLWLVEPNIVVTTNVAKNIAWHKSAIGHGVNKEINTNWDWENTYSAWSAVSCMSMGAVGIEDTGIYEVSTLTTAA